MPPQLLSQCGLSSHGRLGLSLPLWWRAQQVKELPCPLFALSAWAQTDTGFAGTKVEGASVASDRLFGVDSAATVVAFTLGKGAALASVLSVGWA